MISTFDTLANKVIDKSNMDLPDMHYLSEFTELESKYKYLVFRIIWKALYNVMEIKINNTLDLSFPYLGTIKIKQGKKFEIQRKLEIAKELGYNNWIDIPLDKLDEASIKLKDIVTKDIISIPSKANNVPHIKLKLSKR